MMTRRMFGRLASLALGAMLFAQSALALTACLAPAAMPGSVMADANGAHCQESRIPPNLCLLHCLDQSMDHGAQPDVAAPSTPVLQVASSRSHAPTPTAPASRAWGGVDPPIPIRFCVFRL